MTPAAPALAHGGHRLITLVRRAWAQLVALRYVTVGVANTVVGYSIILLGLALGLGDYVANAASYAVGLCLAYFLHRRFTFAAAGSANLREMGRFGLAALTAYCANLSVIYLARSLGYIDNPLIHVLAMATYSLSFFLLNRFIVFARTRQDAAGTPLRWADYQPELALILAAIATWLALLGLRPMGDVVWQFWIARQMLGGARLYADIWEVNPPLWFWSAMPVEWLAERTGAGWLTLLSALLVSLGAGSAWLVGRLIAPPRRRDRLYLLLLVFVMTTVLPMAGLGQREQLVLVTSLPYAALIARRHAGHSVPLALALAVAVPAAYGFALKHYFTLIPLALEAWLALRLRRSWRPLRPELLVLAILALAYAAAILVFAPEFFTVMIPMVRTAYYTLEPPLFFVLVKPYVLVWVVAAGFLIPTRDEPLHDTPPALDALFQAVLLTAGCFVLAYLLQHRGWDYHAIPATGAIAIAVGLRLMRLQRTLSVAVGAVSLAWLVFALYPLEPAPASRDGALDRLPAGSPVFVASSESRTGWAPERQNLVWTSRAYALWMVPAIARGELVGPNTPELRQLAARVLTATSQDIRCHPPRLILMEAMPEIPGATGSFTFRDFLLRDAALRRFLADHYAEQPPGPQGRIYLRRGPVAPAAGLACRSIR